MFKRSAITVIANICMQNYVLLHICMCKWYLQITCVRVYMLVHICMRKLYLQINSVQMCTYGIMLVLQRSHTCIQCSQNMKLKAKAIFQCWKVTFCALETAIWICFHCIIMTCPDYWAYKAVSNEAIYITNVWYHHKWLFKI